MRLRTVIVLILALGAVLLGGLKLHDLWLTRTATYRAEIAERDRAIARRDTTIARRDSAVRILAVIDSLKLQRRERALTVGFASATARWEAERDSLRAALARGAPVDSAPVNVALAAADTALAECKALNGVKDERISNLSERLARGDTTRAALDSNRVAGDSTRTALEEMVRPPFWKRVAGWIGTRAPAAAIGFVLGTASARR